MGHQTTIAIIYDFDGTLSPAPMQEYTVFPEIGVTPGKFWEEVIKENSRIGGEQIITYMMMMLKKANDAKYAISKQQMGKLARKIRFFPGVEKYFNRINKFVRRESSGHASVRHYVISAGLKEILVKTRIKKYLHKIFACEYAYDHYGAPQYPKLVVTDTVKTQFVFRINKGREDMSESINEYMQDEKRPIPFSNILYIGDGLTDVPCMTVTTKNGGYAIAVHRSHDRKGLRTCKDLFRGGRVDFIAKADYSAGSELDHYIKTTLKLIIHGIGFEQTQREMVRKNVTAGRNHG